MIRTVTEAREAAKAEPKRWRAALCENHDDVLDSSTTRVTLYVHVKTADEAFRIRVRELLAEGYRRTKWGVSSGIIKLENVHGSRTVWLAVDKRRTTVGDLAGPDSRINLAEAKSLY